ncbi:MAG: phage terminase large subunit [Candidatus Staskawiczbacteria bacterium]|nr:phage terminase large subunit [Candidatus Staskawiczbacteria bacterium]
MEESEKVNFSDFVKWTPKQREADLATKNYKYILYGGAMGGGKSYWLRWEGIKLLMYYWGKYKLSGVMVGLFCEDYPALKDRHLSKVKFEFPTWLGTYSAQDHNFILSSDYGGGILGFRNLDDVSKYQSSEFAAELVDELTKNDKETFDFLRTRLRWPGIEDTKFLAGTNPGGIGHVWVKNMWIDKKFDDNEQEKDKFAFIQAKAADNPHIAQSYYKSLESLPEGLRKAFLEGDWDLFKGQFFGEWRRNIHVCKPFQIPSDWKKFVCGDYGFAKPAAVYWNAVSPDGVIYIYRELYCIEHTFSDLAKKIIAMTPESEELKYWVFDPSIWSKKGESELSGAEIMQSVYREIMKKSLMLLQGNNDRINGARVFREYLKPYLQEEMITAKLQVFENCMEFIRTVPALVYDATKVEDCDTDGEDHSYDSERYGLMSAPTPAITSDKLKQKLFNERMRRNKERNKSKNKFFRMV